MKAKKRELFPPDDLTINNKIKNLFKGVNKIPFEDFVDFLQVDRKYVLESIHIWAERYNIRIIENLVIKNSD
jgi:3-methyladenine DNA glycosylase/8-oxoguanine DNA glycosylase